MFELFTASWLLSLSLPVIEALQHDVTMEMEKKKGNQSVKIQSNDALFWIIQ